MNHETKNFIIDIEFESLYQQLSKKHNQIKPKLAKEKLEAIGYLIIRFQRLEHSVKDFIGLLANISNDRPLINALLSKHSFKNLVIVLQSIAIQKDFHRIKDLNLLINKALKAEEIRNQLIHSVWTSGGRFKTTLNSGKGVKTANEQYLNEELNQIAEIIDKIDTSMGAIMFDYIDYCNENGLHLNGVKFV